MYQALYRKYRPTHFEDVVSQKAILTTLQNAVKTQHVSHAYLFSGPRGTGKTTVAKIFARLVNCEQDNGTICDKCKNCVYSLQHECMDIIEIDAASNNGVDEIRSLREKIAVLPTQLKYKVYIIDEVHMLSIGAFNALLKTLEEPPKHVIFILATTDPQKIPSTIISRCQCYQFKKITNDEIVARLKQISNTEKIKIDQDVLEMIAASAEGGLRDAIGLLDKISSYQTEHISMDDFLVINGSLPKDEIRKFEDNLFSYQTKGMFESVNQYYNDGKDLIQILKQLMLDLKNQLVDYYLNDQNLNYDEQTMIDFINLLNEKLFEIKKSDDIKMYIEIMFLHFMNQYNEKVQEKTKIISREIISSEPTEKKENKMLDLDVKNSKSLPALSVDMVQFHNLMSIRSQNIMREAKKAELLKENNNWKNLEDFTFDHECGYLACELLDGKPCASSENGIIIRYEYDSMLEKISLHFEKLIQFFQNKLTSSKQLAFVTEAEWNRLKQEYIQIVKSGKNFEYQEEPVLLINDVQNDEIDSKTVSSEGDDHSIDEAVALFGDIVEIN